MKVSIAARGSRLSRAQVAEIQQLLPLVEFSPLYVDTLGDRDKKTSLRSLGKSDFFTRELDEMLLQKEVRATCHSAKDLPDPLPTGLIIAALTAGVDPRDCIVLREGESLESLPRGSLIATSSERREEMVQLLRSDLSFCDLRGTIQERLLKVEKGEADGIVIAEAALVRLKLTHLNRAFLPGTAAEHQGRLAIIVREDDQEMRELFQPLHAKKRPWTILHLGLDPTACPSEGRIYHYPVIRTSLLPAGLEKLLALWSHSKHLLFTSKSAIRYLPNMLSWEGKVILAIGEGTAALLREKGIEPLIAPVATQEGMVELLQKLSFPEIYWPRSSLSRDLLSEQRGVIGIDLYETVPHRPGHPPSLEEIDEIVFMSPSCVEGFCRVYGRSKPIQKITVQGPITQLACERIFG